jgi:hypothetical protein
MDSLGEIFDKPCKWLLLSSVAHITVVRVLATRGILMEAIGPQLVFTILMACVCDLAVIDLVKVSLQRRRKFLRYCR